MPQKYKAVYFPDMPAYSSKHKALTLAFGNHTKDLYEYVRDLSSEDIKLLIGYSSYRELAAAAEAEDLPLNTFCLRQLKKALAYVRESRVQYTFPFAEADYLFNPLTATFRGGRKEPFQRWYPFIEGYSPEFVEKIIRKFAPNASKILDPFAGTGTTVFTAAMLGKESYFCELNPVLQFITQVKIKVRRLSVECRTKLADNLAAIRKDLGRLNDFDIDQKLVETYKNVFGSSIIFDESVFSQVLKARTWIDYVRCQQPMLGDLLTVAVLSALVPASRMKRAGDLRYRTEKELKNQNVSFIQAIRDNIALIEQDLRRDLNGLKSEPVLLCENAYKLSQIPYLGIDTVITSPPYVNGTNYFRNTKIELWFLRCLQDKNDLAAFRAAAVTAGINDVTVKKTPVTCHSEVEKLVRTLEHNAYDKRIPRMIASYFSELSNIFGIIRNHLTPQSIVAIDIGDSCFAGIHVPTDRLLSLCLQELGFRLTQEITLRRRRSRGGSTLTQSLLIFGYGSTSNSLYVKETVDKEYDSTNVYSKGITIWKAKWEQFKQKLPHQQYPYAKRNWGHPLHSLCSYPGKLKPSIAYHLVSIFTPANGRILDPFAGVGTIPFEAALQGRKAYGFELNPAAFVIANAKLKRVTHDDCADIIEKLSNFIKNNEPTSDELAETQEFGFNGKIVDYYEKQTLREVVLARRYFKLHPPITSAETMVLACLLHILHGNRPYALSRRSHPLTPYKPTGRFEYRPLIPRLKEKVIRSLKILLTPTFEDGQMYLQDATSWWPLEVCDLDAIITSPPFFDSTRFYLVNWLRLWFVGWSKEDFGIRPLSFLDERQKQSFEVYAPIFRQARERLRPGGVVVFHLGKSKKCDMATELKRVGRRWFRVADIFDESVVHCESHGVRDKGTVTSHQYLVLY